MDLCRLAVCSVNDRLKATCTSVNDPQNVTTQMEATNKLLLLSHSAVIHSCFSFNQCSSLPPIEVKGLKDICKMQE